MALSAYLITTSPARAQHEFANWVWKDSNSVSWTTGSPVLGDGFPIVSSARDQASISDRNGQLLLVADGHKFYNGDGDLMVNGSPIWNGGIGHYETLIVPYPCNDSLYYVFWSKWSGGGYSEGIRYALVNVYANGGQGEVLSYEMVLDTSVVGATMDVTRHGNNRDYWIVAKRRDESNVFNAWQISDTGIVSTPVISVTDSLIDYSSVINHINLPMRFSPDGSMIATSDYIYNYITSYISPNLSNIFSFDIHSGIVENKVTLNTASLPNYSANNGRLHCFSPDNSKLYIIVRDRAIWQFDLSSGDSVTIANSGQAIATYPAFNNALIYDIQMADDQRLYIARAGGSSLATTYLAVIENPNDTGTACNYNLNGFQCNQWTYYWLPNRIHNLYVSREIQRDSIECTSDTTTFSFDNYAYFDSAEWFIDTGAAQFSVTSDSLAQVVFDSAGVFPIMAVSYSGCRLDTFYDTVTVLPTPVPDLGNDTILCEGDTIALANTGAFDYLWSTGDTTEGIVILQPDTFWLSISNFCGIDTDTVVIDSIIEALVIFPTDDSLLCDGDTLLLDATVDLGTYLWHDESTDSVFYATTADSIWAEASNACGVSSDTIRVRFTDIPKLPSLDSVLCYTDTLFIDLSTDSLSRFLWYSGDTSAFDTLTAPGTSYWVKEWNICGADSDSFAVHHVFPFTTHLGADTAICGSDTFSYHVGTAFGNYTWSTGDTSASVLLDLTAGSSDSVTLWVSVSNACMSDSDSVTIVADRPIDLDLGEDRVFCEGDSFMLSPQVPFDTAQGDLLWFNGSIALSVSLIADEETTYWATATNLCGAFIDSVTVRVDEVLTPNLGPDRAYCYGDTIELFAGQFPRTTYSWQGLPDSIQASEPLVNIMLNEQGWPKGSYSTVVRVINTCGVAFDTVVIDVDSLPAPFALDTVFLCEGETKLVSVGGTDVDRVEWMDGSSDTLRKATASVIWTVSFFNQCGKTDQVIPVDERVRPSIKMEQSQLLCDDYLILAPEITPEDRPLPLGESMYIYHWSDGTDLKETWVYEVGTYRLTVTDRWECADSTSVMVATCGPDFYAPNAFTPDGDRLNERWAPQGEGMTSYTVWIYDRWGNMVHSFTDQDLGWDGTVGGKPAPSAMFFWKMEYTSHEFTKSRGADGQVTLVR